MKYTPHGQEMYAKKHAKAVSLTKTASIIFLIISGVSIGHLVVRQEYVALLLVLILVAAFMTVRTYIVKVERYKEHSFWSHYGKPQPLSFGQQGFHFEEGVPYRSSLLREIVQNEDGHPDYLYLVENISTGDYYVIETFRPLPYEMFRCSYSENALHFVPHEATVH